MAKKGANYVVSVVAMLIIIALVASTFVFGLVAGNPQAAEEVVENVEDVEVVGIDPAGMAAPTHEPNLTQPTEAP